MRVEINAMLCCGLQQNDSKTACSQTVLHVCKFYLANGCALARSHSILNSAQL
jgi:hypothetical protein